MKIRESIHLTAAAETVWPWVADPALWPRWNPKVIQVNRNRSGPVVAGEHFGAVFELNHRRTDSQVEVTRCEAPSHLAVRQRFTHRRRTRMIELAFDLEPSDSGVRLTQSTDLADSGIPWTFQAIIWWICRFGRPVGISPLEELKRLLEQT